MCQNYNTNTQKRSLGMCQNYNTNTQKGSLGMCQNYNTNTQKGSLGMCQNLLAVKMQFDFKMVSPSKTLLSRLTSETFSSYRAVNTFRGSLNSFT